jgi:hypothetical protein
MAAKLTPKKVALQAGTTSNKGNAMTPGTGFKITQAPMPVQQSRKPWFPSWHQNHPSNKP